MDETANIVAFFRNPRVTSVTLDTSGGGAVRVQTIEANGDPGPSWTEAAPPSPARVAQEVLDDVGDHVREAGLVAAGSASSSVTVRRDPNVSTGETTTT